jgi:hypothetical protein
VTPAAARPRGTVIGIAAGLPDPTGYIPEWRRKRGANVAEVVHAPAATHLGPACNLGRDPAVRLIAGWEIEAACVTCWACRNGAAG